MNHSVKDLLLIHVDLPPTSHRAVLFIRVWPGIHPSLMPKAVVVHAYDDQDGALFHSLIDCEIARDTDASHAQSAEYTTSNLVVQHFHTNTTLRVPGARLEGYIQEDHDDQDVNTTISHFREAPALSDHALSLCNRYAIFKASRGSCSGRRSRTCKPVDPNAERSCQRIHCRLERKLLLQILQR
ncbi:uncharacterized protein F5147DRAFT_775417 [Suillus discolor]|uniref:Uncharacterized protein n=1 Tax=Suillus discolor TaxID=1912936 RepID=A0A9P7JST2_9AGAM|nr:uncharacterized protein F5147DRAFT_775417 [Suillus discolor]KAG2105098.1 hypothetical protein F5147DRAFT_775417 [Suillus discolor]